MKITINELRAVVRSILAESSGRVGGLSYKGDSIAARRGWDTYGSPEERSARARYKRGTDRFIVDPHWGRLIAIELDGQQFDTHEQAISYLMKQGYDEQSARDYLKQLSSSYAKR